MQKIALRLSNGQLLTEITDQTIDRAATSLVLPGRGAINYAADFSDNFVRMLENFSNDAPPARPLIGQLWYDTTTALLKLWTGTQWRLAVGDLSSRAVPYTIAYRDENADFAVRRVTGDLVGNASSADKWSATRLLTIGRDAEGSVGIDGAHNVTLDLTVHRAAMAERAASAARLTSPFVLSLVGGVTGSATLDGSSNVNLTATVNATPNADPNTVMRRNENGDVAARIFYGTASHAQRWEYPRTLTLTGGMTGAVQFDGSGDITLLAVPQPLASTGVVPGRYRNATVEVQADGRLSFVQESHEVERAGSADYATRADTARLAERANYADEAGVAGRLKTARQIALTGPVTGSAMFDGSGNITIQTNAPTVSYTASNAGSGPGQVFAGLNGSDFRLRTIRGAGGLGVATSGDEIVLTQAAVQPPNLNMVNIGQGAGRLFAARFYDDYQMRSLQGQNGISISQDDTTIYIRGGDLSSPDLRASSMHTVHDGADVVFNVTPNTGYSAIKIAEVNYEGGGYGRMIHASTGCTGGFEYFCYTAKSGDAAIYLRINDVDVFPNLLTGQNGIGFSYMDSVNRGGTVKVELMARASAKVIGRNAGAVTSIPFTFTGYNLEVLELNR